MQGPIPGQSLTSEPGAAPYEKPPRFNTPEAAFEAYLDKFDDPEMQDALFQILENGIPLSSVVTMLTRQAVNNGIHSVDMGVIMKPMVLEYLSVLADAAGVEYEESVGDSLKKDRMSKKERSAIASRVNKQLEARPEEEDDLEMMSETPEMEELVEDELKVEESPMEPSKPMKKGLMSRPGSSV